MSDANERKNHLFAVVDNLISIWNDWSENSDIKYITREFEQAVEDLLAVFSGGTIPGELRQLSAAVVSVQGQWLKWVQVNEASGGKTPIPDNGFWKALEAVESARKSAVAPVRRRLESIAQLDALNPPPSDSQICKMYGFTDNQLSTGEPLYWMLAEERAAPGTHTGPDSGWMPPHERRRMDEGAKQDEIFARIRRQRESKLASMTRVAEESIEQLLALGVHGKQICKMKKISQSELADWCEENGFVCPAWESAGSSLVGDFDFSREEMAPPMPAKRLADAKREIGEGMSEDMGSGETAQTGPAGPVTLEYEIIQYHKMGMDAKAIAADLTRSGTEITSNKVTRIINQYRNNPEEFTRNYGPESLAEVEANETGEADELAGVTDNTGDDDFDV